VATVAGANKAFGRGLLEAHGIPVPRYALVHGPEGAVHAAREIGYPVVLKRVDGGNSDGVMVGIGDDATCAAAAALLMQGTGQLLVEETLSGVELRLHFVAGKLFRVFACRPTVVRGDGVHALRALIDAQRPGFYGLSTATAHRRRRLLMQVFPYGARSLEDIDRFVPAKGQEVRIASATGSGMESCDHDAIHPDDRAALERLLGDYGAPSAGLDVITKHKGARLSDGGGVLEINSPCGSWYLKGDLLRAVDDELLALVRGVEGFAEAEGRVPVWLADESQFPAPSRQRAALERSFHRKWGKGVEATLSPEWGWPRIVADRSAEALLVWTREEALEATGMPHNLRPTVQYTGLASRFEKRFPVTVATAHNAGGALSPRPIAAR
jgi:hypothetical protein